MVAYRIGGPAIREQALTRLCSLHNFPVDHSNADAAADAL
jgi:hypothetical protein